MSFSLRQAFRHLPWTALSLFGSAGLQFVQMTVIARLTGPEEMGRFALVVVVSSFVSIYAELGLSKALIQKDVITPEQLSTLYWLNLLSGGVASLALVLCAPLIPLLFDAPNLADLLLLTAPTFLLTTAGQQPVALMQRALMFKQLALVDLTAISVATAVAIALAHQGHGADSFIWGIWANAIIRGLLASRHFPPPPIRLQWRDARPFMRFSLFHCGDQTAGFIISRLDHLLTGLFLTTATLGFYSVAYAMTVRLLSQVNETLRRILFPLFSRIQKDQGALRKAHLDLLFVVSTVNSALVVGLILLIPDGVVLLLGERWAPAIPLFQNLCLVALFQSLDSTPGALVMSAGRTDLQFRWNLIVLATLPPLIALSLWLGGLETMIRAIAIYRFCTFLINYRFLLVPVLGPFFRPFLGNAFAPVGVAALVIGLVATFFPLPDLTRLERSLCLAPLGVVLYAGLMMLFFGPRLRQI